MALFLLNSEAAKWARRLQKAALFGLGHWVLGFSYFCASGLVRADTLPQALLAAETGYTIARASYFAFPGEIGPAWRLARACFDLAEFATNDLRRASLAEEGINIARFVSSMAPTNAAGHYYLALNLGQLARTKSFGALSLLRQMERAFLRAIDADPHFDHAGPVRSLGMLYLEAPGWPMSIGSKVKARQHLESAVALEPDYPDNHLTLLEAYVRWNERDLIKAGISRYQKLLPAARAQYTGPAWAQAWKDWNERWQAILGAAPND